MLKDFLELLRPYQWYKNLVIFLGIIFSHNLFSANLFFKTILAFILICLLSSATYIVNDIVDLEKDKKHPIKKRRPLPSGRVKKRDAEILAILLFLFVIYFSFKLDFNFGVGALIFLAINILYSFLLREVFILDVITISINFALRAILGVVLIHAYLSPWLIVSTFLLALVLALGKRKGEIGILKEPLQHRKTLQFYRNFLADVFLIISSSALFTSYCIYSLTTTTTNNILMIATIPIAIFLLFRYIYFYFCESKTLINPEFIFKDKQIIAGTIILVILVLVALYGI